MHRLCWGILIGWIGLSGPGQAIDVQHMQKRLNNTVQTPAQVVSQAAEKIICKTDKKPICYANGAVFDGDFALVRVHRPEGRSFFMLFQKRENTWQPIYSRPMESLNWEKWQADQVLISDLVAQRLIKKLQAVR